jgi:hypothetical protein
MENFHTDKTKPAIFSVFLVLLVAVVLSCLFPSLYAFSSEGSEKALTENSVKDPCAERENSEEKEFSGQVMFSTDYRATRFSNISNLISVKSFTFKVPQVSLDIPVPPPKNHTS